MSEERDIKPSISNDGGIAGPSQDPMTPQKSKSAKMTLIVQWQGQQLQFSVKPTTPFKKIMDAALGRFNITGSQVRFTYDGTRLRETETPDEHNMTDGDEIDIQTQQVGGTRY